MGEHQIVQVSASNMRRWGRQALEGNWGTAVLGALLFTALTSFPAIIFNIMFDGEVAGRVVDIYTFLVGGPLNLGFTAFMIAIFRKRETSPMAVLYGFEEFFKAFALMLLINILVVLWSILLIIPGIIAAYRYSMSFFILADNPEKGILEVMRESKRMMMGNKMKFFLLQFSFIGWAILAIITMGIGALWVLPYATSSFVGFYEVARGGLSQEPLGINSGQGDIYG